MKDAEDDKNKAMKCREITLAVFVDISKPFDTINFNILVWKLHKLYFSKTFLYLVLGYLSNQTDFIQIVPAILLFCIQILICRKDQFWDH